MARLCPSATKTGSSASVTSAPKTGGFPAAAAEPPTTRARVTRAPRRRASVIGFLAVADGAGTLGRWKHTETWQVKDGVDPANWMAFARVSNNLNFREGLAS